MWFNPEKNIKAATHSEIRAACPQVSMPAMLTEENITEVGFCPLTVINPEYDKNTQEAKEVSPIYDTDHWVQQWQVSALSPEQIAAARQASIPHSVTRLQALLALQGADILATIEAAIAANTDPIVKLAWDNASTFDRQSPLLESLTTPLGLTDTQVDDLFIAAGKIVI